MLFLFWTNAFSPSLSLSISLVLYSTSLPNYRCRYSFVRSSVRSFVRASLYLHISFYSRIPSRVSPLRYRPSPPPPCLVHLWSFSFLIRLTLLVAFERNGLEAVPLALRSAFSFPGTSFHQRPIRPYPFSVSLPYSPDTRAILLTLCYPLSTHTYMLRTRTCYPYGYHGAYTTSHMHLHACNPRVSRSRIAR